MTEVHVDPAASQALSDEVASALARLAASKVVSGLMSSPDGASGLFVTDRLPTSASVVDHLTGLATTTTDPAAIASMLTGPSTYVGADGTTPGGSAVTFDWGAGLAGKQVVYVGSIMAQDDHVLHYQGMYGMDDGTDVSRAIAIGLARSFSDAVGGMRSDALGVDHGQTLVDLVDSAGWVNQVNSPDFNAWAGWYGQGPVGFQDWGGNTVDALAGTGGTTTFQGLAGGGWRVTGEGLLGGHEGTVVQDHLPVGADVLGQRYETYVRSEITLHDGTGFFQQATDGPLTLSDAAWAAVGDVGINATGTGVLRAAFGVHSLDESTLGDGPSASTLSIGVGLGLWGFASGYNFDHARMVGIDWNRDVSITSRSVAYGAQTIDGDVVFDADGATGWGTSRTAPVMAIDDRAATADTVVVGGGGTDPSLTGRYDSLGSVDLIQAGSGDDIVLVGDGRDPLGVLVNVAHGNDGSDIVVGGAGNDRLYGDAGNDMLVVSDGVDVLDGGAGFDVADASNAFAYWSNTGVVYDSATGLMTGERTATTLVGIERVNGTTYDDVLHGGAGQIVDGGRGNDVLGVGSGGIAIGGDGADRYEVSLAAVGNESVLLLGVSADDTIWFDGVRVDGSTDPWSAQGQDPLDYWTNELLRSTSADSPDLVVMHVEHHVGGAVIGTTDVYLAGLKDGGAGLSYAQQGTTDADVQAVVDAFRPTGYVPQDHMFGLTA